MRYFSEYYKCIISYQTKKSNLRVKMKNIFFFFFFLQISIYIYVRVRVRVCIYNIISNIIISILFDIFYLLHVLSLFFIFSVFCFFFCSCAQIYFLFKKTFINSSKKDYASGRIVCFLIIEVDKKKSIKKIRWLWIVLGLYFRGRKVASVYFFLFFATFLSVVRYGRRKKLFKESSFGII